MFFFALILPDFPQIGKTAKTAKVLCNKLWTLEYWLKNLTIKKVLIGIFKNISRKLMSANMINFVINSCADTQSSKKQSLDFPHKAFIWINYKL